MTFDDILKQELARYWAMGMTLRSFCRPCGWSIMTSREKGIA